MKKITVYALLLLSIFPSYVTSYGQSKWYKDADKIEIPDSLKDENAILLKFDIKYNFRHNTQGDLVVTHVEHKLVKILNSESINSFNTYAVLDENIIEWNNLAARTISPNGKVTEFDKSNIKNVVDEDTGNSLKIFAVDGIEAGGLVEFLIEKTYFARSFVTNYIQREFPVLEVNYELTCPNTLRYELKAYNGYMRKINEFECDSIQHYVYAGNNIPAIYDEPFSYTKPNKTRIEYRLDRNLYKGKYQINTWDDAAQKVYGFMYQTSEKEQKEIEKYLSTIQFGGTAEEQLVEAIEKNIKTTFLVKENGPDEYLDLAYIIKNKVATEKGIVKLYANLFQAKHIQHQVVLTCERDDAKFDPSFQTWNFLTKYLISINGSDKYIAPSLPASRLGSAPPMLEGQLALFIRPVSVGEFTSAVADIQPIKVSSSAQNYDDMFIDLKLDDALNHVNVELERCFNGQSGGYLGRVFEFFDEAKRTETLKQFSGINDYQPDFIRFETKPKSAHEKTKDAEFVLHIEANTDGLIEFAGNKMLVKLGMTIGPQAEMYQENERKLSIENFFNRSYYREIKFTIPQGYKISNPEVANFEVYSNDEENSPYAFVSKASLEGGVYSVIIDEYYNELFAPIVDFEPFRKVVNAAADFNKIVIVLEKI